MEYPASVIPGTCHEWSERRKNKHLICHLQRSLNSLQSQFLVTRQINGHALTAIRSINGQANSLLHTEPDSLGLSHEVGIFWFWWICQNRFQTTTGFVLPHSLPSSSAPHWGESQRTSLTFSKTCKLEISEDWKLATTYIYQLENVYE